MTCPWRGYSHPIMGKIHALHMSWDDGNLSVFLTDDDPAILHDALLAYRGAVLATRAETSKRMDARSKAKRQGR